MMARYVGSRKTSLLVLGSLGALSLLFACSSSDPAQPPPGDGGGPPPDGGAPTAEAGDALPDAGPTDLPPYDFTVKCDVDPCVTRLAARGGAHACAVLADGTVRCWGSNSTGQLGIGGEDGSTPAYEATPRLVHGITGATDVATAGDGTGGVSCIVATNGEVSCFGSDAWGHIGGAQRSSEPVRTPVVIEGVRVKTVTLASTFALAVGTDDRLWGWGANDVRQLAQTTTEPDAGSTASAARADRISGGVRAGAGTVKTGFAVLESGALVSWGGGTNDQLGRTTSVAQDPVPAAIALPDVSSLATGAAHACAVSHGEAFCWGANSQGQLGTGRKADEPLPAAVVLAPGVHAVAVFAGGNDSCAIAADGDVYCWGASGSAHVRTGSPLGQAIPTRVAKLGAPAVQIGVMDDAICALLRNGAVACWGDNLVGQLGRGSRDIDEHPQPEPVVFNPAGPP
jgi:alpha-tubulin suppressor-like RCC1 family protein